MTFNQVVRGSNPRCLIEKDVSQSRGVFLMLDMGGLEPRTTQLVGAHEVRWTSALSGPKRSGERVPDVSSKKTPLSRESSKCFEK